MWVSHTDDEQAALWGPWLHGRSPKATPWRPVRAGPGVAAWPSSGILVRGAMWASFSGKTDGGDFS